MGWGSVLSRLQISQQQGGTGGQVFFDLCGAVEVDELPEVYWEPCGANWEPAPPSPPEPSPPLPPPMFTPAWDDYVAEQARLAALPPPPAPPRWGGMDVRAAVIQVPAVPRYIVVSGFDCPGWAQLAQFSAPPNQQFWRLADFNDRPHWGWNSFGPERLDKRIEFHIYYALGHWYLDDNMSPYATGYEKPWWGRVTQFSLRAEAEPSDSWIVRRPIGARPSPDHPSTTKGARVFLG